MYSLANFTDAVHLRSRFNYGDDIKHLAMAIVNYLKLNTQPHVITHNFKTKNFFYSNGCKME